VSAVRWLITISGSRLSGCALAESTHKLRQKLKIVTAGTKYLDFISRYAEAQKGRCQLHIGGGAEHVKRAEKIPGNKNRFRWFFQYIFSTPQHGGRTSHAALFSNRTTLITLIKNIISVFSAYQWVKITP
jgi:hypothetical protein